MASIVARGLLGLAAFGAVGCGSGAHGGATPGDTAPDDTTPGDTSGAGGSASSNAAGASPHIGDCPVFPGDNPWNRDISALPVRADSSAFIDSIGRSDHVHPDFGTEWQGAPIGIPFVTVSAAQRKVPINFTAYGDESDSGPYPVPADAPIEGGKDADGDRHVLVVDTDACVLYELYRAFPGAAGAWSADSGASDDDLGP